MTVLTNIIETYKVQKIKYKFAELLTKYPILNDNIESVTFILNRLYLNNIINFNPFTTNCNIQPEIDYFNPKYKITYKGQKYNLGITISKNNIRIQATFRSVFEIFKKKDRNDKQLYAIKIHKVKPIYFNKEKNRIKLGNYIANQLPKKHC